MKPIILVITLVFSLFLAGCSTTSERPVCCTVSKSTNYIVTYDVDPYRVYYIGPTYPYKVIYQGGSWEGFSY